MKLFLSSYHLGNKPEKLVRLATKNKLAAIIPNSRDTFEDSERKTTGINNEISDLKSLGLYPEMFDLKKYFGKQNELKKDISKFGLIWVIGGNTFILRKAMKYSGFDDWLISQKDNKDLVYAGYSAGVCVLAPNLKGLELVDEPYAKAIGYKDHVIWEGLGLVDWACAPHYKSDHPESEKMNNVVEYYKKNKIPYKTLHDGESIVMGKV